MKQKWFWMTLFFWTLLASSIVCWALISSPIRFQPQTISQYDTNVNGQTQKTEFWVNQGRLTDLMPIINKKFINDHWNPISNGLDLTSVLLGPLSESFDLSDQIQVRLFEKNGICKTIGLWQAKDTDQTYGMISDIPKIAFKPSFANSSWRFPLPPPPNATQLLYEKMENMEIGFIFLPLGDEAVNRFNETCLSNGFTLTLWQKEKDKKVYLLSNKKIRILAILNVENNQNIVSLVYIKL